MPVMPRTFCFCNDPLPTITCRCESHSLYRVEPVRGYPSTVHILVVHGGLEHYRMSTVRHSTGSTIRPFGPPPTVTIIPTVTPMPLPLTSLPLPDGNGW